MSEGSKAWSMSGYDWKKLAVGAGVAAAGAALTYLSQWAAGIDFGEATPLVVAGLSVAANFVRKLATDTR